MPSRVLPALVFLALLGCAGPSSTSKKEINRLISEQNFVEAASRLNKIKESEYGKRNAIIYYLDVGAILHYAGKYKESDEHFDKAESRMEQLFTKSATKASGTLLFNDNTVDYAGEAFERALTNVFRALNYAFMGKLDEALVESRKVEAFLDELNAKLEKKRVYKDDAFARYLDSLFYADAGKLDDARISHKAAMDAYSWYRSDYNTPTPRFDADEDKNGGELVFIHYNGTAPRKISKTWQIAWGQGLAAVNAAKEEGDPVARDPQFQNALTAGIHGNNITVSYPEYVQDPYTISASEIEIEGRTAATVLMEDITAIAMKDLKDHIGLIKTRAIARSMVKYVLAKAAEKAVADKYGKNSWQSWTTQVAGSAASAVSEIADTRGWSTLPSQIRMARVKIKPGRHSLVVHFKDNSGSVITTRKFSDVIITQGKRTYLHYRTAI